MNKQLVSVLVAALIIAAAIWHNGMSARYAADTMATATKCAALVDRGEFGALVSDPVEYSDIALPLWSRAQALIGTNCNSNLRERTDAIPN